VKIYLLSGELKLGLIGFGPAFREHYLDSPIVLAHSCQSTSLTDNSRYLPDSNVTLRWFACQSIAKTYHLNRNRMQLMITYCIA
jgi:hypothetical protein